MQLYVQQQSICTIDKAASRPYGPWRQEWEFSVRGVSLTRQTDDDEVFYIGVDVSVGDTLSVLCLEYTDGDGLGEASGLGAVLWVFRDPLLAREAWMRWSFACGFHDHGFDVTKLPVISFFTDSHELRTRSNPAAGHHASPTLLTIQPLVVQR